MPIDSIGHIELYKLFLLYILIVLAIDYLCPLFLAFLFNYKVWLVEEESCSVIFLKLHCFFNAVMIILFSKERWLQHSFIQRKKLLTKEVS